MSEVNTVIRLLHCTAQPKAARQTEEAQREGRSESDQINYVPGDKRENIETSSAGSDLHYIKHGIFWSHDTLYEEYMSRKRRRSREAKKRITERVQGLSAVSDTDGYTYQAQR